jgi:phage-related protein
VSFYLLTIFTKKYNLGCYTLRIMIFMENEYWSRDGRFLAKDEVENALKNDKVGQRIYKRRLQMFQARTSAQLMTSQTLKPLKGSKAKLHEWSVDFQGKTGRMFCVIYKGCAYFLHFFIKKSKKGIKTSQNNIDIAEARARYFLEEK